MMIQKGSSLHLCNDTERAASTLGWFSVMVRLRQVSSRHLHYYHANRPVGSRPHQAQLSTVRCGHVNYDDFSLARAASAGLPFCHKSDHDASPLSGRRLLSAILKILRPIFANPLPIDLMDVGKEQDMVAVVAGADMMRLMVLK